MSLLEKAFCLVQLRHYYYVEYHKDRFFSRYCSFCTRQHSLDSLNICNCIPHMYIYADDTQMCGFCHCTGPAASYLYEKKAFCLVQLRNHCYVEYHKDRSLSRYSSRCTPQTFSHSLKICNYILTSIMPTTLGFCAPAEASDLQQRISTCVDRVSEWTQANRPLSKRKSCGVCHLDNMTAFQTPYTPFIHLYHPNLNFLSQGFRKLY